MRKTVNNIFLGLCVLAVGVGYLGNYIDVLPWTDFTVFFPGWWALIFVIPPICFMILSARLSWWAITSMLFGIALILNRLGIEPFSWSVGTAFAVLLILIGIRLIFSPLFRRDRVRWRYRRKAKRKHKQHIKACGDRSTNFAEETLSYDGQTFTGTDVSVSFGELTLDLRGAAIQPGATLYATCSFGELSILLPDDPQLAVDVKSNVSFGNINHSYPRKGTGAPVVLTVYANCSFGEISIV